MRAYRLCCLALVVAFAACGGSSGPPPDASVGDAAKSDDASAGGDDGAADAGGVSVTTVASIPLPARPNGMAIYDPDTGLIYVGMFVAGSPPTSGGVAVIDTTTNKLK